MIVPRVPTGMNTGVRRGPCLRVSVVALAFVVAHAASTEKDSGWSVAAAWAIPSKTPPIKDVPYAYIPYEYNHGTRYTPHSYVLKLYPINTS